MCLSRVDRVALLAVGLIAGIGIFDRAVRGVFRRVLLWAFSSAPSAVAIALLRRGDQESHRISAISPARATSATTAPCSWHLNASALAR